MGIETSMLVETAVYWAPDSPDAYGQPTFAEPVEIAVRWETDNQEFVGPDGEQEVSKAVVYSGVDLAENGVLLYGKLTESVDQDDPFANAGAHRIRRFQSVPFLKKVTRRVRIAYL